VGEGSCCRPLPPGGAHGDRGVPRTEPNRRRGGRRPPAPTPSSGSPSPQGQGERHLRPAAWGSPRWPARPARGRRRPRGRGSWSPALGPRLRPASAKRWAVVVGPRGEARGGGLGRSDRPCRCVSTTYARGSANLAMREPLTFTVHLPPVQGKQHSGGPSALLRGGHKSKKSIRVPPPPYTLSSSKHNLFNPEDTDMPAHQISYCLPSFKNQKRFDLKVFETDDLDRFNLRLCNRSHFQALSYLDGTKLNLPLITILTHFILLTPTTSPL